jgi:hypothetical protein
MAIEAGQCDVACHARRQSPHGDPPGHEKAWGDAVFGWFSVVASYAMIARDATCTITATEEQLARIAIAARAHGRHRRAVA